MIRPNQHSDFLSFWKKRFLLFLYKEINPPPPLFFALFVGGQLGLIALETYSFTVFIIGVLFAIIHAYNHFFYYSPVLNGGIGQLGIFNMLLGIMAAN